MTALTGDGDGDGDGAAEDDDRDDEDADIQAFVKQAMAAKKKAKSGSKGAPKEARRGRQSRALVT